MKAFHIGSVLVVGRSGPKQTIDAVAIASGPAHTSLIPNSIETVLRFAHPRFHQELRRYLE